MTTVGKIDAYDEFFKFPSETVVTSFESLVLQVPVTNEFIASLAVLAAASQRQRRAH